MGNENAYNNLVGKDKSKIQFGKPTSRWKGDIKTGIKEMGCVQGQGQLGEGELRCHPWAEVSKGRRNCRELTYSMGKKRICVRHIF